ncbi:hypothetical protein CDCA_CDCA03G0826 [Cyanidium caldarium]|uniref:Sulfotransferase n=1 Tax=Cyanidium caldarium TaxID=2771 RepID=A0AAV9IRI1_CYACA|nr:hypothetical protein CDCA_CDCA03G0826 [Cyanidium caldarium]
MSRRDGRHSPWQRGVWPLALALLFGLSLSHVSGSAQALAPAWQAHRTDRPLYIFLAGVEGAGHEVIRELLEPCVDREVDDGSLHLDGGPDPRATYGKLFGTSLELALRDERLLGTGRGAPAVILDAHSAYPLPTREREPARRVDLETLLELHERGVVDVRVVALWRDPLACAAHAITHTGLRDPLLQARVIEESLLYLSKQLEAFPTPLLTVIDYDRWVREPQRYADTFRSLLRTSRYCGAGRSRLNVTAALARHQLMQGRVRSWAAIGGQQCKLPASMCAQLPHVLADFFDKRRFLWEGFGPHAESLRG